MRKTLLLLTLALAATSPLQGQRAFEPPNKEVHSQRRARFLDAMDGGIAIVWRSAPDAYDRSFDSGPIIDELYPDRETFKREEQRRFQLVEEHLDVPVIRDDLSEWETTTPTGG